MENIEELKILVIDDDESLVAIISEVLEGDGFAVTTSSSGEEALDLIRTTHFPLIITDIRMPGISGIELMQEVKKINQDIQVIIMTSYASVESTISALHLGAYDYLLKPFDDIKLISIVVKRAVEKIRLMNENKELMENLMESRKLMENINSVLHKHVVRDGLTGLYNHKYFYELASQMLLRCQHQKSQFSIIIIDVDHFKEYNDRFGHPAGDEILIKIGDFLKDRLKSANVAARYGGEEFIVLLSETSKDSALIYAETLRQTVSEYPFKGCETQPLGIVSISMGVSSYPEDGAEVSSLISSANDALYKAKASGRNRVITVDSVDK
jgi:diguanylate cyclase (GGDEF)-like protein